MLGQPTGDLVEQQHARFCRQRARQFKPFAIEQGQAAGALVGLVGQTATLEQFGAAIIDGGFALAGAEGSGHDHVLEYGHAGERLRDLERAREALAATAFGRKRG